MSLFGCPTDQFIPRTQTDYRIPEGDDSNEFFVLSITNQELGSAPITGGDGNTPSQRRVAEQRPVLIS